MKKVVSRTMIFVLILAMLVPQPVKADTGPKPSVIIEFTGAPEGLKYYGTLLSESASTGPAWAWDGSAGQEEEYATYYGGTYEIWKKMVAYEDSDGYYFLQRIWDCTETQTLDWTYYPPDPFKILLYFPDYDVFAVSGIYERYAFHSYYTVNLTDVAEAIVSGDETNALIPSVATPVGENAAGTPTPGIDADVTPEADEKITITPESTKTVSVTPEPDNGGKFAEGGDGSGKVFSLSAEKNKEKSVEASRDYDYAHEGISLICRIVITILLELFAAWCFKYRAKKQLLLIICVNIFTQILLNVMLNVFSIHMGYDGYIAYYLLLEIAVFAAEAYLYSKTLGKPVLCRGTQEGCPSADAGSDAAASENAGKRAVLYALTANLLSFAAGICLANVFPMIF